jgi:hypothetical protein
VERYLSSSSDLAASFEAPAFSQSLSFSTEFDGRGTGGSDLIYRRSSPFCVSYASFSSDVLGTRGTQASANRKKVERGLAPIHRLGHRSASPSGIESDGVAEVGTGRAVRADRPAGQDTHATPTLFPALSDFSHYETTTRGFHHCSNHATAECRARFLFSRFELRSPSKYRRRARAEAKPFDAVSLQNFSSHKNVDEYRIWKS